MNRLGDIIREEIEAQGPMSLGRYMELCLGHPEHGYYMTRDPLGQAGDFVTAPEISQMFGELIGAWIADAWMKLGSPAKFTLLECGPGRGTLMADAMRVTEKVPGFHDAVQLHLLESSPVLRKAQKKNLGQYKPKWHMTLESVPQNRPIIVVGNEFLDALPVCQLKRTDTGWVEKAVKINENDTLCIDEIPAKNRVLEALPEQLFAPKLGDLIEVSHERRWFVSEVIKIMEKQGGISLFIDYGFTVFASGDTLQAVKNHLFSGFLETPGECDLTSHVNFAEIEKISMEKGMVVHGPVAQGVFLKKLGITHRADALKRNASPEQAAQIASAIERLTGEEEMGKLFKVIALCHDPAIDLEGFA